MMSIKNVFRNVFRAGAVLFLFLLSSCTSISPPHQIFINQEQQTAWLNSLQTWEASGRFAVKQGNEGSSGSFEWQQYTKNNYKIHFYGPLGFGNAYLTGYSNGVTWQDNQGTTTASTPEALIAMKTQLPFPVSNLYDWILGRPAAESIQNKQEKQGHLIYLEQAGWHIDYLSYMPVGQGELPNKIEMTAGDIKIKLIVNEWKVDLALKKRTPY